MADLLLMILGFLPEWFILLVAFAFMILVVIIVLKILAIIWDALPFV